MDGAEVVVRALVISDSGMGAWGKSKVETSLRVMESGRARELTVGS